LDEVLKEIESVVRTLNQAQVRYLIVGGVAVVLHGFLRTTEDLDLVIQLEPDNVSRVVEALQRAGFRPRASVAMQDFADPARRSEWISEKGMVVFTVIHPDRPSLEVDLFVAEPFDFDAAFERAPRAPIRTQTAPVVALEDLIALKRKSGRHVDLADVEALENMRARIDLEKADD
jgi:predicted nucleotidyltransferase